MLDDSPRPRSRRRRAATLVGVATVAVGLAAGCGSSGRELRAPEPGATAPPRSTGSTAAPTASVAPAGLTISSPAWVAGSDVPAAFTCDGDGTSPPLVVTGVAGAQELVVVVTDQVNERTHWLLAGIAPEGATIPDGAVPEGVVVGLNSEGVAAWAPMCPNPGDSRTYEFAVYALSGPSAITAETTPEQARAAITQLATASAATTGSYARGA
jgi:phosphatidylethanolamine-binding protein (PEBP) family uncharacterized protein